MLTQNFIESNAAIKKHYFNYVKHLHALVCNKASLLGFRHFFATIFNYGYRPKAYNKLYDIARKHFPEAFIVTGLKKVLMSKKSNYYPSFRLLATFIKNVPQEKRTAFFMNLLDAGN